jgi:hypothetical protein
MKQAVFFLQVIVYEIKETCHQHISQPFRYTNTDIGDGIVQVKINQAFFLRNKIFQRNETDKKGYGKAKYVQVHS